ncbi:transcriptional regulator, MarR family protein [Pseudooceanicola batsensis HTCC2597]|uniref:Transcriptional regulator, MarR family protein n=1 Tax=Pseudooceanicola batsensis (strain ATCC BAA-863 / DSM 15984 / KCTC 12145 / HTCC2597) TaxID=252305 RepID=A3TSS9_PSEBH|nr:MarR family transcriptional regulator [Pseudooceanicola batsensis]EAQ04706.1 transcriptional regulator, MarR family protein [Pseudooceanicola batsensis HTCC2597]
MSETDPDRVDESLIALRRILRATEQYERDLASAAGLSPAQLRVLQIIAGQTDKTATPKALAQRMGVTQATVTSVVDKLVARGHVRRVPSETDRRQTNVILTVTGRSALEEAPDALQQRYVREFVQLADWEQAQLVASLERVAGMLDAHLIDASPVLTVGEIDGAGKRK